jgi:hypothetical protein
LEQTCCDSLLPIVIDTWEDKGKDPGIRKMFSSPYHRGYSLDDDVKRKIEKLPEWREYRELLRDALEAQSARASVGSVPQPEPPSQSSPQTETTLPSPATKSNADDATRARKTARRNPRFERIDERLREVGKSLPTSQQAVFGALDGDADVPDAEPFAGAGGWLAGFESDPTRARSRLSKNWSRLKLPPLTRGPKK